MESTLRHGGGETGLRLIETLLWDGSHFPRLAGHIERLQRSQRLLGWRCAPIGPGWQCPLALPAQPARVRLTVDAGGQADWQLHPLPAGKPEWRLGLATARYVADDPWLRVKSSRRSLQDQTRAAMAAGFDELLFCNERDEVCEGTITNLFFDRGQGLRTPPLRSGLLPGVLRQELACPEEVLHSHELPQVRLWVGNALRGLIPARFAP